MAEPFWMWQGIDLRPFISASGWKVIIREIDPQAWIEVFGPAEVFRAMGAAQFVEALSAEQRKNVKDLLDQMDAEHPLESDGESGVKESSAPVSTPQGLDHSAGGRAAHPRKRRK